MDKFNRDELQAPSWMDIHFLEEVLKSSENTPEIKITDFEISPATQRGDHFASIMFRANIKYVKNAKPEEISIIIKTMPVEDGVKLDILKETYAFETEIAMYSEAIPKFESILQQSGDKTKLGARMLYGSLSPRKVIVFEDIRKEGYGMFQNRFANFDEMKKILEKICRWHAVSFKLISEGDNSLRKFKNGVLNMPDKVLTEFFQDGMEQFLTALSNIPNGQVYCEKFKKIKDSLLTKGINLYSASGNFCVLNHGDFHLKNMMFQYSKTDEIQDVMLVDFQFCVLAPITIDLIYLLLMIVDTECRSKRDEIIYIYYNKFVEALTNLGFTGKIPSLSDLHVELLKNRHIELFLIASMFPFACAMMSDFDVDPEKSMESSDARAIFYKLPNFVEELKKLAPMLLHKGYFEE